MRYIANDSGQVLEVSFGAMIVCGGRECTEYVGDVPAGYDSLVDWFTQEGDKLHRWQIVEDNLTKIEDAPGPPAAVPFGVFKVWENPNPTEEFDAQTIDLQFASGDLAQVFFAEGIDAEARCSVTVQYGKKGRVMGTYGSHFSRRVVSVLESGVTISAGSRTRAYGEWAESNVVLIPLSVYKITGLTDLTVAPTG